MYELLSKRIKNADGEPEMFTYNSFPQAFRNQVFYILEDGLEPYSTYNETWIDEGAALTFGDATFDQKIMDAHKLHVAIKVTEELLYDNAFNLESYIITQFGKALANAEEDAFLNGDDTGKPTGIFDATHGGHLLNTLSAGIKSDDMLDLVYGLKRPYRKGDSFIMNDGTLAQLRKLKDNNGAYI